MESYNDCKLSMDFDSPAYVLPMLNLLAGTNSTIGLHENIIFDVVGQAQEYATQEVRPISEEIRVKATAFHVTCGLLPQARQNGTQANTTVWNIVTPVDDSSPRFDAAPIRLLSKMSVSICPSYLMELSSPPRYQISSVFARKSKHDSGMVIFNILDDTTFRCYTLLSPDSDSAIVRICERHRRSRQERNHPSVEPPDTRK
jgi:hypothetical protein